MSVNGIVNINITRQTAAVSRAGFGIALVLGDSPSNSTDAAFPVTGTGADKIREYEDLASVAVDFPVSSKEYMQAAALFGQEIKPSSIKIGRVNTGGAETYVDAINAIVLVDDDWYALAIIDRDVAVQDAVSIQIEAMTKIFMASSNDDNIIDQNDVTDTTSIAALTYAATRDRTAVLYHDMGDITGATSPADPCFDGALLGDRLPTDAGSSTWAFKDLSIPVSPLSTTQRNNAHSKNANTYERRGGVGMTFEGTMASGEYIDVIRGVDWLQARMCERIFGRLVNLEKIPFTDAGIAIIEAEIRAAIDDAIGVGFLTGNPEPEITVPLARDVATNDRANRCLPDVKFTVYLAGAIHKVVVNGVVSV